MRMRKLSAAVALVTLTACTSTDPGGGEPGTPHGGPPSHCEPLFTRFDEAKAMWEAARPDTPTEDDARETVERIQQHLAEQGCLLS